MPFGSPEEFTVEVKPSHRQYEHLHLTKPFAPDEAPARPATATGPIIVMLRPESGDAGNELGRKFIASPADVNLAARLRAWRVSGWRSGGPKHSTRSVVCGATVSSSSGVVRAKREGI